MEIQFCFKTVSHPIATVYVCAPPADLKQSLVKKRGALIATWTKLFKELQSFFSDYLSIPYKKEDHAFEFPLNILYNLISQIPFLFLHTIGDIKGCLSHIITRNF